MKSARRDGTIGAVVWHGQPKRPAQRRATPCRCPRDRGSEPISTCQDQCAVSFQVMRFAFTRCDTIPKLGWCAHLQRGKAVAHVYHGPCVETRDDWFVEGAWTDPFERGELDKALFLVGSGGVVRSGRAIFCTQTDMIERLYSIRAGDDLFMSNSLAFVLAMAGDEPDPCYPFYARKLRGFVMDGISRKGKVLRTRRGRQVELHEYCQVAVSDDLRLVRIEKPVFRRPTSFEDYRSVLHGVLGAVLKNAASPERRHRRYEGLAMVSGGYDSNALAALLSRLGVREAMTFYDQRPGVDSGEEVARLLGMAVRVYGRTDFRTTPGVDEAEFLSWPDQVSDIVTCGVLRATGRQSSGRGSLRRRCFRQRSVQDAQRLSRAACPCYRGVTHARVSIAERVLQFQSLVHRGVAPVGDARDHDISRDGAMASGRALRPPDPTADSRRGGSSARDVRGDQTQVRVLPVRVSRGLECFGSRRLRVVPSLDATPGIAVSRTAEASVDVRKGREGDEACLVDGGQDGRGADPVALPGSGLG